MITRLKVLVIEDQRHDFNLAKHALSRGERPCQVSWVKRGEEALDALRASQYDVALLDHKLPGINGLETFQKMQMSHLDLPTIFVTGSGTAQIAVEALKLGARDYVVKDSSGNYLNLLPVMVQKVHSEWQNEKARLQAEAALRESDERLRSTIASLDDLVFVLDKSGRIFSYYQSSTAPAPYKAPEFLLDRHYQDVLPPHVVELIEQALEKALASDSVQQFDYSIEVARRRYWFSAKLSLRYDAEDRYTGATIVVRDITERQQAAALLEQRAAQLEALREVGLNLATELELDTLLGSIVTYAVALLGGDAGGFYLYEPEKDLLELSLPNSSYIQPARSTLSRDESLSGKVWASGEPLIVNNYKAWEGKASMFADTPYEAVIGVPVQWHDDFLGVLSVAAERRLTFTMKDAELLSLFAVQAAVAMHNARLHEEIRRTNQQLEARVSERTAALQLANQRLQQLDELKTKFIHDMTHELRTPLANLSLYLELLAQGQPEKRDTYLEVLTQQSERLEQVLRQVVELTELAVEGKDKLTAVNVNDVVENILNTQLSLAQDAGLDMAFLPQPELQSISGNQEQIARMIKQLITNAITYTHAGEISIRTFTQDGFVGVEVADTGIGIAKEELPLIFDRFYRGKDIGQSTIPGPGVGLTIVKEIAMLHGGDVKAKSEAGQGSTFRVLLPIHRANELRA